MRSSPLRRVARALTALVAVLTLTLFGLPAQAGDVPPDGPAGEGSHAEQAEHAEHAEDGEHLSLHGDIAPPDLPPRPKSAPSLRGADTPGWNPVSSDFLYRARPTYVLRFANIGGRNAAVMRNAWQRLVTALPNVDITIAPGTVARGDVRTGEILVSLSTSSGCTGDWVGCAGPRKATWISGTNYTEAWINAGRIWIHPKLLEQYGADAQYSVYQHELGHVLGMGHFDSTYQGSHQIMKAVGPLPKTWRHGDRNGLWSARKIEKGWANFRVDAITTARVDNRTWLTGADAVGNVWVRRPRSDGSFYWQDLDGTMLGSPATVVTSSAVHLFAVGSNGDLYQRSFNRSTKRWNSWTNRLALNWVGGVSAVRDAAGRIHVFGRRSDRSAALATNSSGSWVEQSLGGGLRGDLAVHYIPRSNAFTVWGVGLNSRLHQIDYVNGAWSGWFQVPGTPNSWAESVDFELSNGGMYNVFGLTYNGKVRRATWKPTQGWRFNARDTLTVRGRPGALRNPQTDRLQVFAVDTTGRIRVTSQQANGTWTSLSLINPR